MHVLLPLVYKLLCCRLNCQADRFIECVCDKLILNINSDLLSYLNNVTALANNFFLKKKWSDCRVALADSLLGLYIFFHSWAPWLGHRSA
jgi:hypothetical protein